MHPVPVKQHSAAFSKAHKQATCVFMNTPKRLHLIMLHSLLALYAEVRFLQVVSKIEKA
jgi:hypothetical protein